MANYCRAVTKSLRGTEAKQTLLIPYKRKINANRTLLIHELKKIKANNLGLFQKKERSERKKMNGIEVKQIEAVF
jgi:hypothetical protein